MGAELGKDRYSVVGALSFQLSDGVSVVDTGVPVTASDAVAMRCHIARLTPRAGWPAVLATIVCEVALGALPVLFIVSTSVMLGRVPAAVAAGPDSAEWTAVVIAFTMAAAAFAAQQALAPLQTSLGELVAQRVDGHMFDRLMSASLRSPGLGPLQDQRLLADLSEAGNRLRERIDSPGQACAGLLHLIARVVQLAGYVVVIGVAFSWWAAIGVLAAVLMFRYGQRGGLRKYSQVFHTVTGLERESHYLRGLALRAPAAKEIRVFGLVRWLTQRYRRAHLSWIKPVWRARRRVLLWPYVWYTSFGLLVTAAVLAAVGAAGADEVLLTNLALVIQAVLGGVRLGEFYPESDVQTQFGMDAYQAVRTFERGVDRHTGTAAPSQPDEAPAPALSGTIRLDDVTFRYPGQPRPVLHGLQLVVRPGQCTAIVGANGAGKTTLVTLLTRLYEPEQGVITVDGTDIRSIPVDRWRARIAVIFQDFNRYDASAADNIGLGAVEHIHEREEIRAAAEQAGVLEILDALPNGLDTPLAGHMCGGVELSGGQWQRVALARALFRLRRDGSVLVLDEPTASLDVRSEAHFFDEFVRLTRGATTILISHRFSTVRHADHIVVLADGRVSEEGSHEELLLRGGRYARLFRLQAGLFTDDAGAA